MENASKAIIIAGGMLIGLLTISVLVVMFFLISSMANAKEEQLSQQELKEWNAQWESYNKRIMYGSEVITLINKIAEENLKYVDQPEYCITITVYNENGVKITDMTDYKLAIFGCTGMEYNKKTGRINNMIYKFVSK